MDHYVIRKTNKGTWINETRPISLEAAKNWAAWIKSLHPKQEVFIVAKVS